jgi:hypothetical protein
VTRLIRTYTQPVGISRGGGTASVNRSASIARGNADELPEFYEGIEPSYQVALSASAGRVIRNEIGRERYTETAGWLFCDPRDFRLVVCATGPGSDGLLSRSSVQIGEEGIERVKQLAPHLVSAATGTSIRAPTPFRARRTGGHGYAAANSPARTGLASSM